MGSKIRGMRRKYRNTVKQLNESSHSFPRPHREKGYWHLHLPVPREFRRPNAISFKLQQQWVQAMLDSAGRLNTLKPGDHAEIRVVTVVTLPDVTDSQIIVFFTDDYYQQFMARNCQSGLEFGAEDSPFSKNWDFLLADGVSNRGFNDGENANGQLWLFEQP